MTSRSGSSTSLSTVACSQVAWLSPAAKVTLWTLSASSRPLRARTPRITVSSLSVLPVRVRSKTTGAPSVTSAERAAAETVGSLSSMVPVAETQISSLASTALERLLRMRVKVSSGSAMSSSFTGTEMTPVVCNGSKVRTPLVSV